MFISLALFITIGVICGIQLYNGSFYIPENTIYSSIHNSFFTRMNYQAIVLSIFVFIIYSFFFFLYMDISFENTQSTEIIYFSLFLASCLFESIRILFPFMNLWNYPSSTALIITRVLLAARFLGPLCLLFLVIYSNFESRQYVEQNIVILLAAATGGAICCPLDNNIILPSGYIQPGLENYLNILRISTLSISLLSQIIKSYQSNLKSKFTIGFAFLIIGYIMMVHTYNYALLISGTVFIFSGTIFFLKDLHSQYLWN